MTLKVVGRKFTSEELAFLRMKSMATIVHATTYFKVVERIASLAGTSLTELAKIADLGSRYGVNVKLNGVLRGEVGWHKPSSPQKARKQ